MLENNTNTVSLNIKKMVYDLILSNTLFQKLLIYDIESDIISVAFNTKNNQQILTLDNKIFYMKGE